VKIAGIARDRRHRRNLVLPIMAISRDYSDFGDRGPSRTSQFLSKL